MIIQNIKAKIISADILDGADVKDKSHWVGRVGTIDSADIGKPLSFAFQENGADRWVRTTTVDEILIRGNTIGVEAGSYRYVFERI